MSLGFFYDSTKKIIFFHTFKKFWKKNSAATHLQHICHTIVKKRLSSYLFHVISYNEDLLEKIIIFFYFAMLQNSPNMQKTKQN